MFAKATTRGAHKVFDIFSLFAMVARQLVNFHKSSIYSSSNTSNQDRTKIVNILNIQHKTTIGKYLGIHNIVFWKDPVNESELIKRVKPKLAGWKENSLLKAGRLTLIKSNFLVMLCLVLNVMKE